tara:strand:- start:2917 stop:6165 length:3249 start_codon:yes stop_codon:yes gene_type:complete
MRISVFLFFTVLHSIFLSAQGLKAEGKKIIDQNGNEVLLRGMGLGGWMLMEGYMMQSSDVADTQHEFRQRLEDLMGVDNTNVFFDKWLENHVTKADIDSLSSWGFNSVRLPMHYNLFTLPIEEESVEGENTWLSKGFTIIDELLQWCEENEVYLILDLHAAPGGQGANAAISDYNSDLPSLWESDLNKNKTIALWKKLAERYKDEEWIGGYDLLNEVNWEMENDNEELLNLYKDITTEIRTVDNNHIIFIEGNGFANDFNGLTPPWDDNMVYSFHKYWSENTTESIQWVLDIREENNVPLWMGEAGENSNVWFTDAIELFETNDIGWSWWPMKRIETIVGPYSIDFTDGYKKILSYWRGEIEKPSSDEAFSIMIDLANKTNSNLCTYQKDVPDAQIRQIKTNETIPYASHQIPGVIYMSDYDLGRSGIAYYDVDSANYQQSSGYFQAWNSGWVYRNDGVDIEKNTDTVNSNGFHIGFINKGEWINYTLTVSETGVYSMDARIASIEDGGEFLIEMDEEGATRSLSIESSGAWDQFITQSFNDIFLEEGKQTLTIKFDGKKAFNVSSLEFNKTGNSSDIDFTVLSATALMDGKSIQVLLNQNIDKTTLTSSLQDFSLSVNNEEITFTEIVSYDDKKRTFTLKLSSSMSYNDQIKLNYFGQSVKNNNGSLLENFTLFKVVNNVPQLFNIPGIIQAEGYYNMYGVETEVTSDNGGGLNIGYTNPGDYVDYLVNVEADYEYNIKLRVAAESNSGRVAFYTVSNQGEESRISEILLPVTNGWQNWVNVTSSIQLPKGNYTLRMRIINGDFNMNWIELSYPDSDQDGINDTIDQCPNTSVISSVDQSGCALDPIALNNFSLKVVNETCSSSDNGKIFINSLSSETFVANLDFNGSIVSMTFNSEVNFSSLQAGNYSLCINKEIYPSVKQCFKVVVKQPSLLSVNSYVNPDNYELTLDLSGAEMYYVTLNGREYETSENKFILPLSNNKNVITIKTDLECQGVFKDEMILDNIPRIYPNPISGNFLNIKTGYSNLQKSLIEIYDLRGSLIYRGKTDGSSKIDFSWIPKGIYVLRITKNQKSFNYKIINK